ncbi:MAG: hypothetical protein AB1640_15725 [bacterium]
MSMHPSTASKHRRVRQARSRAAVRAWEYRQRHLAKGVWFRLRRVLAEASSAWAIPEEACRRLIAEGCIQEPVGTELEPRKTILFVPEPLLSQIPERRPLRLRLGAELFAAHHIALVRFPLWDPGGL